MCGPSDKVNKSDTKGVVPLGGLYENNLLFFFRTAFFINGFSNTRKERETQLAEHISRRRPLRLFYRVAARLSLFPNTSNRVSLSTGVEDSSYCR